MTANNTSDEKPWVARNIGPIAIISGAVLAVAAMTAVAMLSKKPPLKPTKPAPLTVEVEVVDPVRRMPDVLVTPGMVEVDRVVDVAAEVSAQIEELPVPEGATVTKGQLLVRLNTDLLQAQFDRAKAEADSAQREFDRYEKLRATGAATDNELDLARAKRDITKAALDSTRVQLDHAKIYAPIDGVLNKLPVDLGEYVTPGLVVAQLVDPTKVKVAVPVPEADIRYFHVGDKETVVNRFNGEESLTGEITYIDKVADPLARTTRVEITVPNEDGKLHSGQIVKVLMTRQVLDEAIMVNLESLIPREHDYMAFVEKDGEAVPVEDIDIDIRFIKGKRVRVTKGLNSGDRLIVVGQQWCGPGQEVRVMSESPSPQIGLDGPATQPASQPTTQPVTATRPAAQEK